MNSKQGQNALELMLIESLAKKLQTLGASEAAAKNAVQALDFNDVRAHLTRTDADLKQQFASLFRA